MSTRSRLPSFHSRAGASPFAERPDSHSYFDVRHDLSDPGEKRRRFGRPSPGSASPRCSSAAAQALPEEPPAKEAAPPPPPDPARPFFGWGGGKACPLGKSRGNGEGRLGLLAPQALVAASAPFDFRMGDKAARFLALKPRKKRWGGFTRSGMFTVLVC